MSLPDPSQKHGEFVLPIMSLPTTTTDLWKFAPFTQFRRCVQYPHFAGTAEKPSVEKDSTKCGGIAG